MPIVRQYHWIQRLEIILNLVEIIKRAERVENHRPTWPRRRGRELAPCRLRSPLGDRRFLLGRSSPPGSLRETEGALYAYVNPRFLGFTRRSFSPSGLVGTDSQGTSAVWDFR